MKIQLKELNRIKGSLSKLLVADNIPARAAYRATKFTKALVRELELLEETRVELVKKYGEKAGDGLAVPPKHEEAFQGAFGEVLEEEVELPEIQLAVGDLENAKLSMLDFAYLDFMIVETDPTSKPKQG